MRCAVHSRTEPDFIMLSVDLNCDVGESFGAYRLGADDDVLRHVTSANIA